MRLSLTFAAVSLLAIGMFLAAPPADAQGCVGTTNCMPSSPNGTMCTATVTNNNTAAITCMRTYNFGSGGSGCRPTNTRTIAPGGTRMFIGTRAGSPGDGLGPECRWTCNCGPTYQVVMDPPGFPVELMEFGVGEDDAKDQGDESAGDESQSE
jgi:hypothetical protein